jgi:WS/DGAT/MGAT family acyltransferase
MPMTEPAQREPMSGVDTAWLRMERPTNPMMITGVLIFAGPLDPKRIRRVIADRFLAFHRFRQRAVPSASGAWWETDEDFDIDWHVRAVALPGAADKTVLEAFVSDLASTPLDHERPLWQFHVVENYRGGGVLIGRIHHCYADGLALMQVLLSLTDTASKPHALAEPAGAPIEPARGTAFERLLDPAQAGLHKPIPPSRPNSRARARTSRVSSAS